MNEGNKYYMISHIGKVNRPCSNKGGWWSGDECWLWKITIIKTIIFNPLSSVPSSDSLPSLSSAFPSISSHSFPCWPVLFITTVISLPLIFAMLLTPSTLPPFILTACFPSSTFMPSPHYICHSLQTPFQINCSEAFFFLSERNRLKTGSLEGRQRKIAVQGGGLWFIGVAW